MFAPGSVEAEILVNKHRAVTSFLNRGQFPVQPGYVGTATSCPLLCKKNVPFKGKESLGESVALVIHLT